MVRDARRAFHARARRPPRATLRSDADERSRSGRLAELGFARHLSALTMDYDDAALRALLESDFRRLTRGVKKAPQIDAVVGCLFTAMKRIMHGLTSDWNRNESTYRLPDELLAACFALLPFRDRVTASHGRQLRPRSVISRTAARSSYSRTARANMGKSARPQSPQTPREASPHGGHI